MINYYARLILISIVFLLLWQGIVVFYHVPNYLLPAPQEVFTVLHTQTALLFAQTLPTLAETLLGFVLGILVGCLAGLSVSFFRPLKSWFLPVLIISQAIPVFAIAPLLVVWLGYGLASKIVTCVLMIFFPVASAFHDGLHRTPQAWLDLAKTMNTSKWRVFWHIRIPAALPSLASGIRIAAVMAPIGAIVGEWVGSSRGLGYLMLNADARMQIDMMFAALLVIILISLILYFTTDKLLRKLVHWQESSDE